MSSEAAVDARRIARNTGWLCLCRLIVMAADVVAVGIVLKALGVDDFGLFAAVSCVSTLICFFGSSLGETSRKFISRERGTESGIGGVFAALLALMLCTAVLVVAVAGCAGLPFVLRAMSFPAGRASVAFGCYACAVGVSFLQLLRIPFESLIFAQEHMRRFVGAAVLEGVWTIAAACALHGMPMEARLPSFALMTLAGEGALLAFFVLKSRDLDGFGLHPSFRSPHVREIFVFFFCGLSRAASVTLEFVGTGILINVYAGVAFNATWKLATKVGSALYVPVGNLFLSVTPQMMRLHAAADRPRLVRLVVRSGLASFLLMSVAVPVIVFAPELVRLWVGTPPPQVVAFIRALAVHFIFDSLNLPLHFGITAIGSAPRYHVFVSLVKVAGFAVSFVILASGRPPWLVPAVIAGANGFLFLCRIVVFRTLVAEKGEVDP